MVALGHRLQAGVERQHQIGAVVAELLADRAKRDGPVQRVDLGR